MTDDLTPEELAHLEALAEEYYYYASQE